MSEKPFTPDNARGPHVPVADRWDIPGAPPIEPAQYVPHVPRDAYPLPTDKVGEK